jgi:hypothetical protein
MSHRVVELHSIMPITNIPSVLEKGVLSALSHFRGHFAYEQSTLTRNL